MLGQARPDTVTEAWLAALCTSMPRLPPKVGLDRLDFAGQVERRAEAVYFDYLCISGSELFRPVCWLPSAVPFQLLTTPDGSDNKIHLVEYLQVGL